jgi:hypothetical protein
MQNASLTFNPAALLANGGGRYPPAATGPGQYTPQAYGQIPGFLRF